jgi:hypothetical protein
VGVLRLCHATMSEAVSVAKDLNDVNALAVATHTGGRRAGGSDYFQRGGSVMGRQAFLAVSVHNSLRRHQLAVFASCAAHRRFDQP